MGERRLVVETEKRQLLELLDASQRAQTAPLTEFESFKRRQGAESLQVDVWRTEDEQSCQAAAFEQRGEAVIPITAERGESRKGREVERKPRPARRGERQALEVPEGLDRPQIAHFARAEHKYAQLWQISQKLGIAIAHANRQA